MYTPARARTKAVAALSDTSMNFGSMVDQQAEAGMDSGEGGHGTVQPTSAEQVRLTRALPHTQSAAMRAHAQNMACVRTACARHRLLRLTCALLVPHMLTAMREPWRS